MTNTFRHAAVRLLLTTSCLTGAALAQPGQPGAHPGGHAVSAAGPSGMTAAGPTLSRLNGRAFDRAFLSMMVPHHQAALDMARAVLKRTRDTQVRAWANAVIRTQQSEIGTMTALLRPLGGPDRAKAASIMASMHDMVAEVGQAHDADEAFVRSMLPHHASAIDMARVALERSGDPRVLKLARDIVVAQAGEMYLYRSWVLNR